MAATSASPSPLLSLLPFSSVAGSSPFSLSTSGHPTPPSSPPFSSFPSPPQNLPTNSQNRRRKPPKTPTKSLLLSADPKRRWLSSGCFLQTITQIKRGEKGNWMGGAGRAATAAGAVDFEFEVMGRVRRISVPAVVSRAKIDGLGAQGADLSSCGVVRVVASPESDDFRFKGGMFSGGSFGSLLVGFVAERERKKMVEKRGGVGWPKVERGEGRRAGDGTEGEKGEGRRRTCCCGCHVDAT